MFLNFYLFLEKHKYIFKLCASKVENCNTTDMTPKCLYYLLLYAQN